ncbi:MAG: MarR family transcriptional regulator [Ignavibacteria bacterium]|nr:MarR family transcriptional regulator [Ignavibacteria bacterium]
MTKPNTKTDQIAEMLDLILQLVKICQFKEQYFASLYNLTTVELRCLQYFESHNSISVKELSKSMELTPGRITHILTSLEKKKLITREINKDDRRGINVCLTKKAIPFVKNMKENNVKFHEKLLRNIPEEKREIIRTALQELINAFIILNKEMKKH